MVGIRKAIALSVSIAMFGTASFLASPSIASAATVRASSAATTGDTTTTNPARAAASAQSIATVQQKGEAAIDRRLKTIAQLQGEVTKAKFLTDADRASLNTVLSADSTGLAALRVKIAADTDKATLKTDLTAIVSDYRIYIIVAPKVHLVQASDALTGQQAKVSAAIAKINARVATLKAAGKDTTAVEADLATATSESAAAASAVSGQSAAALALVPSGYPGNTAQRDAIRTAVKAGAGHAKNAATALKAAAAALKALGPVSAPTTTTPPTTTA